VIRLESGRALPGYTVLMSPPSEPLEPADDSRKMLQPPGALPGGGLALFLALGLGLSERRMRFAETLAPVEHRCRFCRSRPPTTPIRMPPTACATNCSLQPLKRPRLVGKAPSSPWRAATMATRLEFARALAESYARARMKTLFDRGRYRRAAPDRTPSGLERRPCRRDGRAPVAPETPGLGSVLAAAVGQLHDSAVSAPMVRAALERYLHDFDAIIVSGGSLRDRLASQFVLSASDVGVLALRPSDRKAEILKQIDRFDTLPRNGSVAAMRNALPGDPWLAVRT
jgi:hypothetical protein